MPHLLFLVIKLKKYCETTYDIILAGIYVCVDGMGYHSYQNIVFMLLMVWDYFPTFTKINDFHLSY